MTHLSLELDDFTSHNYLLIGIHSVLEDYRIAFFLNKYLQIQLKRVNAGHTLKKKKQFVSYSLYQFFNEAYEVEWSLIANSVLVNIPNQGLFEESETKVLLIPEKKKIDFFLKIEGYTSRNLVDIINQIPQVVTSYTIDPQSLKSKDFLIF